MEKTKDWLARSHESLHTQSLRTLNYLNGHLGDFGIDGKSAQWINNQFKPKQQTFSIAYQDWENPAERTPGKTAALKAAEADFKPAYRELYNGFLKNNPNVSDNDLIAMGLPARKQDKPTPVPVPATYPDLTIEPDGIRRVKLSFKDHDKKSIAKPDGVSGALIRWSILPQAPVDVEDLKEVVFDTKTPYTFTFAEHQRGQRLYCAACWQNTRGEQGSWSEIVNTVIP